MQPNNHSEIARLLAQIDAESEAAHSALYGPAIRAPHNVIEARMVQIAERYADQLEKLFQAEREQTMSQQKQKPTIHELLLHINRARGFGNEILRETIRARADVREDDFFAACNNMMVHVYVVKRVLAALNSIAGQYYTLDDITHAGQDLFETTFPCLHISAQALHPDVQACVQAIMEKHGGSVIFVPEKSYYTFPEGTIKLEIVWPVRPERQFRIIFPDTYSLYEYVGQDATSFLAFPQSEFPADLFAQYTQEIIRG